MRKRKITALEAEASAPIEALAPDLKQQTWELAQMVAEFQELSTQKLAMEKKHATLRATILKKAEALGVSEIISPGGTPVKFRGTDKFSITASRVISIILDRHFESAEQDKIVNAILTVSLTNARKYLGQDALERGGGALVTTPYTRIVT